MTDIRPTKKVWAFTTVAILCVAFLFVASGPTGAAPTPGCTAENPPHGQNSTFCSFIASGTTVNYRAWKLDSNGAEISEFQPNCSTFIQNFRVFENGPGSVQLQSAGNCVRLTVGSGGKIRASG